jgi:magnesium transporter
MDVRFVSDEGVDQHPVDDLTALLAREDGLVWVDIPVCDEQAARVLSEVFGFHPLAVRACIERNAVPKMRAYGDHIFVILHGPQLGKGGHVHYVEFDQFIGPRYLVTVHGPVNPAVTSEVAQRETRAVLKRIEAGRLYPSSGFALSYAIVSALAQGQEAFVEQVTARCGRWSSGSPPATWATRGCCGWRVVVGATSSGRPGCHKVQPDALSRIEATT